jgi:KDO2-lipid IV(A) lauroyltransferase
MNTVNKPVFNRRWLHPRYWHYWLLFGIWWLIVWLPYPVLLLIGTSLGRLMMHFGKSRQLITRRNLAICFPDKTESEREQILAESAESAGMAIIEMGMAWWWPNWRTRRFTVVKGVENFRNLDGQGAILLGMHFVTVDFAGAGLSLRQPYGGMYRPHDNPVYDYVQLRGRFRERQVGGQGLVIFPRGDLRTMIRLLREGWLVWYAPDQDYGPEHSIFAPFFGRQAATVTATAKLAKLGRARVLPFTHRRLPQGRGYEITIHPPLENFPTGDELADATRINQLVEQCIRDNPGQYLWAHRRFKTRPEGIDDPYPEISAERLARRERRLQKEALNQQAKR